MKRLLPMLCTLLALFALTARAEESAQTIVLTQHPGAKVVSAAQTESDAFFVLDTADGTQRLCGVTRTNGVWVLWLDSTSAIRPSGLADGWNSWRYQDVTLTLTDDTLSIAYRTTYSLNWQYDFVKDDAGTWRFVRLSTEESGLVDELTFSDGCVRQTITRTYKDGEMWMNETPPCPMPYLAGLRNAGWL